MSVVRVWVAVVFGVVGLGIGAFGGPATAILIGGLAAWFGWRITKPARPPAAVATHQPVRAPVEALDDRDLDAVARFLDEARIDGILDAGQHRALAAEVARRRALPAQAAQVVAPPARRPVTVPVPTPAPAPPAAPPAEPPPRMAPPPAPPPPPAGPGWAATALEGARGVARRAWESLVSDVAVHGLAYLGVLFVFVATLGFVLFAFSGVGSAWRPVAEAAIPAALFGGAVFLRRRGAPFVAASLELLAGAVTPVVAFAAFSDGAAFPPDLERAPLVGVLTLVALGLAAAYGWTAVRRPTSPLRFLVAPMLWLAAGTVGLAFEEGASAAQLALVAWAVVVTTVAARHRPGLALAGSVQVVALPGLGLSYGLLLVLGGATGWPPVPILVGGAAVIAGAEVLRDRLPVPWAVQAATLALTAAAVAVVWPAGWVAAATAAAMLGLAELWLSRSAPPLAALLPLGAAAAAIAAAAVTPGSLLAASVAGSAWAHVRRIRPPTPLVGRIAAVAAAAVPAAAAAALAALVEPAWVIAGTAAVAVAVIAGGQFAARDDYLSWWGAGYGLLTVAATVPVAATGPGLVLAGAAALGTLAVALLPRWAALRAWAAPAGGLWALALGLGGAGVPVEWWPAAFAAAGAAVVVTSFVAGRSVGAHLAGAGHLALAGSLAAAVAAAPRLVVLAVWCAAWVTETAAAEVDRSALAAGLRRLARARPALARGLPPVIAAASIPFLLAGWADWSGLLEGQRGRMGLALAALGAGYAVAGRALARRRPLAPILAAAGFLLASLAIAVAAPEPWPTVAAVAGPIVVTVAVGPRLRRPWMVWPAWAASAVLTMLLIERAGVATRHLHVALLAWGGALTAGALLLDDLRSGRRPQGAGLRVPALAPPVTLGALAVPIGLAYAFSAAPAGWWPWALGGAGFYIVVAWQLRAGGVSAASYGLAVLALGSTLAGGDYDVITGRPVLLVPVAAVLVAAAAVLRQVTAERDPLLGWSAAPLAVAHAVAAVGLVAALDTGFASTWAGFGGLGIAVGVWRRNPMWAAGGDLLLLTGAAAAGPGWLALALAGNAAALLAGQLAVPTGPARVAMQWAAPGFAGAAWVAAVEWGAWWPDPALPVTIIGAGGLALGLAGGFRLRLLDAGRLAPWAVLAAVATLALAAELADPSNPIGLANTGAPTLWLTACLVAAPAAPAAGRRRLEWAAAGFAGWAWAGATWWAGWWPGTAVTATVAGSGALALAAALVIRYSGADPIRLAPVAALAAVAGGGGVAAVGSVGHTRLGLTLAAGLAMWSAASGLAARRVNPLLRHASVGFATGAAAALGWGLDATAGEAVAAGVAAATVLTLLGLAIWAARPASGWLPPVALGAALGNAVALLAATGPLPDAGLLVAALAATGTQALAAGVVTRRAGFLYAGLPLLAGAWLLFATEALGGDPHWYTIPVGITVLALVDTHRWDSSRRGLARPREEIAIVDVIGMGFVVGAPLVQTVIASTAYGLLAMVLAALVVGYGIASRVRRRCYFGAAAAVLAAAAMVAVPLARVVPQVRGVALWATVAAIGTALILAATYLEQGRARVAAGVRRLEELMGGWE